MVAFSFRLWLLLVHQMIGNNINYVLLFFPYLILRKHFLKPYNIFLIFTQKSDASAIIPDSFVVPCILRSLKQVTLILSIPLCLKNLKHTLSRRLRVGNYLSLVMWTHSYQYNTPYVTSLNKTCIRKIRNIQELIVLLEFDIFLI